MSFKILCRLASSNNRYSRVFLRTPPAYHVLSERWIVNRSNVNSKIDKHHSHKNKLSKSAFKVTRRELPIPVDSSNNSTDINLNELSVKSSSADWSESFGTLSENDNSTEIRRFVDDEGEEDESEKPYRRLDSKYRKHEPDWYAKKIEKLGKAGKIFEAIQVLDEEMLKTDRVRPNQFVFNNLIGVLGRLGYTKKAFKLFNQMKKFGLVPDDHTYSSLFNCCSNAPSREEGLQRANHLRGLLKEKDHVPSIVTYNAMVKAYARCGDIQMAFSILDEAIQYGVQLDEQTFSSLLIACISDKEAGLKHAIEVWRIMRKRRIIPVIQHYNLLLRATRDCNLGDYDYAQQLLRRKNYILQGSLLKSGQERNSSSKQETPERDISEFRLSSKVSENNDKSISDVCNKEESSSQLVRMEQNAVSFPRTEGIKMSASILDMDVPNLLNPRPNLNSLVELKLPTLPSDKLAMFGGLPGILNHMAKDRATPDIKTFTMLLDLIPWNSAAENDLVTAMSQSNVKPDIDFCNFIIRRRNLRKDYKGAKDVLEWISSLGLQPNVRTFGCLAMGCSQKTDGIELLHNMQKLNLRPNAEICDILLFQSKNDFDYKLKILLTMKTLEISPNKKMIAKLEEEVKEARKIIVEMEQGGQVDEVYQSDQFSKAFRRFILNYNSWLQSTKLEPEVHPWARYQQPTPIVADSETVTRNHEPTNPSIKPLKR